MSNRIKLYSLLYEEADIATSISDSIGKAVIEPIEKLGKDVEGLDARFKTYLSKGSTEPTKAKSTTGASLPTTTIPSSAQGIGAPKPSGLQKPETKTAKDLATNLIKDPKFISSLAGKISSAIEKSRKKV